MKIGIMHLILIGLFMLVPRNSSAQKREVFVPAKSRQVIHGRITDSKGKPLAVQVQVWYAHLKDIAFQPSSQNGADRIDNLIKICYTSDDGYYSIPVPPDTVLVIITKGPEWGLVRKRFIVCRNEFDGIEFDTSIVRLYDLSAIGWYAGDMHHHTFYSDGLQSPSEVARAMKDVGLSWGILTDHNSIEGRKEWLAQTSKSFLPILGCELTTEASDSSPENGYGHMNEIFISKMFLKDSSTRNIWAREVFDGHEDVQNAIDWTHRDGGLLVVNHPYQSWDWSGRFKSWGKVRDFDAIEIWNGEPPHSLTVNTWDTNHVNINTWAVQSWFSFLNAGDRVSGVSGSDCHDICGAEAYPKGKFFWTCTTGNPRAYVHCSTLSRFDIEKGIKNGSVFLTSSFGPIVLVKANGKIPGETVEVGKDGKVRLEIKVLGNQSLLRSPNAVRVILNGQIVRQVATDSTYTLSVQIPMTVRDDGWLVVECFGQWPMYAITNPIYLDYPPYSNSSKRTWKDPSGATEWNKFLSHPEINMPDGPTNWKNVRSTFASGDN